MIFTLRWGTHIQTKSGSVFETLLQTQQHSACGRVGRWSSTGHRVGSGYAIYKHTAQKRTAEERSKETQELKITTAQTKVCLAVVRHEGGQVMLA